MKKHLRYFFALITVLPLVASAQPKLFQRDTSIKVFAAGKELPLAWCGGFNNPQFAMADLNHDGLDDLVILENGVSLKTFINIGTPGNYKFKYVPEYINNFPPCYSYCIMKDYNRDGIPDLFEEGQYGFSVYKGYYNESNQLCFTYYRDLWYPNDARLHGELGNAFTNPNGDIPAIVDVDNDGDLDFIAYNVSGGTMNWYRNLQVEDTLPPDSIRIALWTNCWGQVYQGSYRTHTLASPCAVLDSFLGHYGIYYPKMEDTAIQRTTHSGNTPCLFDYDMDGDYDYLDGSISFNQMTFLLNGRIPLNPEGADTMIYQDTMWQSLSDTTGTPVEINIPQWAAAFNVDIDGDGKKDLLVSTINNEENYKCIWFYKNYTTSGHPDWEFQTDTFLIDQTIDIGNASYPMLYDYNKDGLLDLFIGSDGYYEASTGTFRSKMSYYENTGTPGHPVFTLISRDFMGLSSYDFEGIAPAFGDIDGDGVDDLVMGHKDGTLSYLKNMAASNTVIPNCVMTQVDLTDMNGDTINADGYSAPFMYDMDKDGKKDLVIGNYYGTLVYYQNANITPGTVNLKLINNQLGHISVDPKFNFNTYSTPYIGPIDTSGIDYMLVGANSGNIYEFTGFQSSDTTATYTMLDSQFSYIDSFNNAYAHLGDPISVYNTLRTSLTVGDVAKDGGLEMITGNIKGGVELFKWGTQSNVSTPIIPANEVATIRTFPNPASEELNIYWTGILQPHVTISIIDMEGQVLSTSSYAAASQHSEIKISMLPPGMYLCQLQSGVNRYYSKFTVVR